MIILSLAYIGYIILLYIIDIFIYILYYIVTIGYIY